MKQAVVPVSMGSELTPREIVAELDKYIIGQDKAKKAVAIALRNRTRRQRLPEDLRDEVAPKNIIMIGPTGVGKDGNCPKAFASLRGPLPQGGGHEIHGGRLRGPRRGVHGT